MNNQKFKINLKLFEINILINVSSKISSICRSFYDFRYLWNHKKSKNNNLEYDHSINLITYFIAFYFKCLFLLLK